MLGAVILMLLIFAVVGALPTWDYSQNWGAHPSRGLGLLVLVMLARMLAGRI